MALLSLALLETPVPILPPRSTLHRGFTVAASTIDREFPADVILGGGVSLYSGDPLGDSKLPLVYSGDCGSQLCYPGKLDPSKVAGKLVLCDRGGNARVEKGSAVKLAGGAGMILANLADSGEELVADSHLLPATMVGQKAGDKIREYVKSDSSPTATIVFKGTVIGKSPSAPRIAAFSCRGPNYVTPEILKPDVTAPGVNILTGWTGSIGPTDLEIDTRRVEFNSPQYLNYSSFSVVFSSENEVKYKRVVKNVGRNTNAVYEVKINSPASVEVKVTPTKLSSGEENKSLSYEISFSSNGSVGLERV